MRSSSRGLGVGLLVLALPCSTLVSLPRVPSPPSGVARLGRLSLTVRPTDPDGSPLRGIYGLLGATGSMR